MVPYLLVGVVAWVLLHGLMKLGATPRQPHAIPWRPLFVWAALLAGGAVVWILAPRIIQ
jgi:hypothetical protein